VVVDPPYLAGTVIFEENHASGGLYTTTSELSVVMEGNKPLTFEAKPEDFWYFDGWTSNIHTPTPDAQLPTVNYNFQTSDTIVAHFVKEDFRVFVPNSFTPNNDGKNDVYQITDTAIDDEDFHMMIFNRWGDVVFNRWGDVVFESRDINMTWVGEVQGGDYYYGQDMTYQYVLKIYQYVLKIKSVHETSAREMSGTITAFR